MSWKDKKGATSDNCNLTTTFTVLPQQTNPNWNITKNVVEKCIDENTENPKAELAYTVVVTNTGDGSGTISRIEDFLDSKVQARFLSVSSITSPGTYTEGNILWNYASAPLSFTPGQSRTYTYKIVVTSEFFDTYANTVKLTPVGSDMIMATANITADCEIYVPPVVPPETPPETPETPESPTVPQTGIFDSTVSRIMGGFVLVLLGAFVYNIPNGLITLRSKPNYKYRERFEKKVANK
jgi:hypothetical protein